MQFQSSLSWNSKKVVNLGLTRFYNTSFLRTFPVTTRSRSIHCIDHKGAIPLLICETNDHLQIHCGISAFIAEVESTLLCRILSGAEVKWEITPFALKTKEIHGNAFDLLSAAERLIHDTHIAFSNFVYCHCVAKYKQKPIPHGHRAYVWVSLTQSSDDVRV